ncbi:MAG TPA: hypothetical protein VKN76_14195 [Kiloniellaceae bacterium]|nr:hypothetical protein [Kiloniellaceae bacterium]
MTKPAPPRGGFKKRYLLYLVAVFLGILLFRYRLPEPFGSFGIAVVESIESATEWIGRHLAL